MNIHVITAAGPAFPTLPGKETNQTLFISETLYITTTSDANFLEARANIEKADRVVVSQVWDPYAYIELGLAMQLNKQIVVVGDDDLIQTGLFPKYDDFVYEKAPEDTVSQYLTRLSKSEN
ncbi:hypothetical protein VQ056_02385 [Paenibacillus sp. JTLBN-2024]